MARRARASCLSSILTRASGSASVARPRRRADPRKLHVHVMIQVEPVFCADVRTHEHDGVPTP
eukprot:7343681-Prymnesium_polylepis.1